MNWGKITAALTTGKTLKCKVLVLFLEPVTRLCGLDTHLCGLDTHLCGIDTLHYTVADVDACRLFCEACDVWYHNGPLVV